MSSYLAELWAAQRTWSHSGLVRVSLQRETEAIIGCQVGDREGDIKDVEKTLMGVARDNQTRHLEGMSAGLQSK